MAGGLIYRASELMQQQAAAYRRFNLICERLAAALIRGDLEQIEALTRSGEGELLGLRSRLAQLTSTLTSFAARRSSAADCSPVSPEARAAFESASNELMMRARAFQQTRARVAALAANGVRLLRRVLRCAAFNRQPIALHMYGGQTVEDGCKFLTTRYWIERSARQPARTLDRRPEYSQRQYTGIHSAGGRTLPYPAGRGAIGRRGSYHRRCALCGIN
jgi:hypothetical protein